MPNSSDVTAGNNAKASEYNNLRKDVLLATNYFATDTDGGTVTFDLGDVTKGNCRTVTLGGNRTLALSNVSTGQRFVLALKQDATGSRTVTWFSGILWPAAVVPTLTTTPAKYDVFGFICIGAGSYLGVVIGQNM
jgi:hypothetical protein